MLYMITAVLAGALIASQSSCNGLLFPALGVIGVGFVSQGLNAVTILLYQLVVKKQLPRFRGLPPYAVLGGITGVLVLGGMTVITRMFSFFACRCIGLLNGSLSNVAVGALASLILLFMLSGFRLDLTAFAAPETVGYLTGPLGAAACLMNTAAYEKLKIFRATVLIMAGQIGMRLAADILVLHSLPAGKALGIAVICGGIAFDKRLTRS